MSDKSVQDAPPKPAAGAPNVEAMIEALRGGGEMDSAGTFTLNRKRARQRLRDFQLADPSWYLLLLIQAAVRQGAERIEVDIDVARIRFRFDGRPFTSDDLESMYDELLTEKPRTQVDGRHELALGLNAALAQKPSLIQLTSGDGKRGVRLDLASGKDEQLQEQEVKDRGTTIEIKLSLGGGGLLERSMSDAEGVQPEEVLLRQRCCYASAEIVLRVESEWLPMSRGLALYNAEGVGPVAGEGLGLGGQVGFRPASVAPPELRIVMDGVWITTHQMEGALPGFLAVVSGDALRKDLSQFDVVRDDAYLTLQEAVNDALEGALGGLCERVDKYYENRKLTPPWIRAALMGTILRLWKDGTFDKDDALEPWVERLARTSLWAIRSSEGVRGGIFSLSELKARFATHKKRGKNTQAIERILESAMERALGAMSKGTRARSPEIDSTSDQSKPPMALSLALFFGILLGLVALIIALIMGS